MTTTLPSLAKLKPNPRWAKLPPNNPFWAPSGSPCPPTPCLSPYETAYRPKGLAGTLAL